MLTLVLPEKSIAHPDKNFPVIVMAANFVNFLSICLNEYFLPMNLLFKTFFCEIGLYTARYSL